MLTYWVQVVPPSNKNSSCNNTLLCAGNPVIKKLVALSGSVPTYGCEVELPSKKYLNNNVKNSIHIKVYSNFLKDTAESMGFTIDDENYDYVVYPDYLADEVQNETQTLIEISSHNFVSKNPFVRLEKRYEILEKLI